MILPSLIDVPHISSFAEATRDVFLPFGLIYVKIPLGILSLHHGPYTYPASSSAVLDEPQPQRVSWNSISFLNRDLEGDLDFAHNYRTFEGWSRSLERTILTPFERFAQRFFRAQVLHRTFYRGKTRTDPHIHKGLFTILFSTLPQTIVWVPGSRNPKLLTPPPGYVIVMLGAQGRFIGKPVLHCISVPSEGCTTLTFSSGSWVSPSSSISHAFTRQRQATIIQP